MSHSLKLSLLSLELSFRSLVFFNCSLPLLLDFICYNGYDQIYVGSGSCCDPDSVCYVENPNESAFCKNIGDLTGMREEQCVGTGWKLILLKNWLNENFHGRPQ